MLSFFGVISIIGAVITQLIFPAQYFLPNLPEEPVTFPNTCQHEDPQTMEDGLS